MSICRIAVACIADDAVDRCRNRTADSAGNIQSGMEAAIIICPSTGSLSIAGNQFDFTRAPSDKAIRELRQNVGMVFQQYNLWPHLTVQQNLIEAPCRVLGLSKDQALARAEKLLERLRLKPYSDRYPLHLSGLLAAQQGKAERIQQIDDSDGRNILIN